MALDLAPGPFLLAHYGTLPLYIWLIVEILRANLFGYFLVVFLYPGFWILAGWILAGARISLLTRMALALSWHAAFHA